MAGTSSFTLELLFLGLGLTLIAWRLAAAIRAGRDAAARGFSRRAGLAWALSALVYPAGYWWRARLERLNSKEANNLLQSAAHAHRLTSVVNSRCPLCDAEIVNALAVTASGALAIRPLAQSRAAISAWMPAATASTSCRPRTVSAGRRISLTAAVSSIAPRSRCEKPFPTSPNAWRPWDTTRSAPPKGLSTRIFLWKSAPALRRTGRA
jgi:hypothetical protein